MRNPKRALIFGETRLCVQCIEFLISDEWEILTIFSDDKTVINWAVQRSIKYLSFSQLYSITEDGFYIFSIVNSNIIPLQFLQNKNIYLGINYHDSLLPKYAGINSTTWAIINGELVHGVTLHQINMGVDEGDIIEQTVINIAPDETALSLNLKCSEQLLVIFKNILTKIANGAVSFTPQLLKNKTYYGLNHIPSNYAIINGIIDIDALSMLIRGLTFGEEKNTVATVKIYLNDKFYILENAICSTNYLKFPNVRNIYGQSVDTKIDHNDVIGTKYNLSNSDLHYITKIKNVEIKTKQYLAQIFDSTNSITILGNVSKSGSYDVFSKTLSISQDIPYDMALAIIYFVLIRYFHENFVISLYVNDNSIPNNLFDLLEKRNFIIADKKLLNSDFLNLKMHINRTLENAVIVVKDFFYRYKLPSTTDIAIIFGPYRETDLHKLTIIFDNNQITINSSTKYELQVNGLIEVIQTVADQKENLLNTDLNKINILSTQQSFILLNKYNHYIEFPQNKTLHALFEEQVLRTPDNIALRYRDVNLTYKELNNRANQLAGYLITAHTITPDTLVALCLDRSDYMLIAILGVLKSGGAYVPIDPLYPLDRITYIITDTEAEILITHQHYEDNLSLLKTNMLIIDKQQTIDILQSQPNNNTKTNTVSTNLAYVIYTSGTTGKPKGVLQQHNNVMRLFKATEEFYKFNSNDVWTLFHSYVFDFSVWEIWGALIYGGTLIMPTIEEVKDTYLFYNLCYQKKITVLNQTPKSFYQFIEVTRDRFEDNPLNDLRYVIFGGDALQNELLLDWFECYKNNKSLNLINMYGITETTVHVTYKQISFHNIVESDIGRPIPDMQTFILDENLNLVPIGAVGELYIGGAGLARGYLNQPRLTAERFIANPFQTQVEKEQNKNFRLYKTGDLARMLPDGNLQYLGRNDFQVKIRGYRIELAEIENALITHPDIKQAVVITKFYPTHELSNNKSSADKYLIAYYVSQHIIIKEIIIQHLKNILPEYMIPLHFVHIKQLPLTINGKLDISVLPTMSEVIASYKHIAPKNTIQAKVCNIFAEVLKLDISLIGIHDNFFNLGGDSILAIQIIARIRRALNIHIQVYDLYKFKTIANLVKFMQLDGENIKIINENNNNFGYDAQYEKYVPYSLVNINNFSGIDFDAVEDIYPASYLQLGILLESELHNNDGTYHDVFYYQINYKFDESIFLAIWQQLVMKHQHLRAKFIHDNLGKWQLIVLKVVQLQYTLYSSIDLKDIVDAEQMNPFDYKTAGLFRLIVNNYDNTFDLIFSFSHIIADGWSVAFLINEFIEAYVYAKQVTPCIDISGYALFLKNELKSLQNKECINFWQNYLADVQAKQTKWKFNYKDMSKNGLFISSANLTYEESKLVKKLAKLNNVGIDNIFLYAYLLTLSFFLNSVDLVIGLVVNNRPEINDGDKIFGLFLNTIPYKFKLDNSKSVKEILCEVFTDRLELSLYKHLPYGFIKSKFSYNLYQFAFNFINFHILANNINAINKIGGFEKTNIPFVFTVYQQQNNFKLEIKAHDTHVDQQYLNYFVKYLKLALVNIINNRNQLELDLADYNNAIYRWNSTAKKYARYNMVQQIFEYQVIKTPDSIAVIFEEQHLTYRELNNKSNQLGRYLYNKYNFKSNMLIILCIERNEYIPVSILGILKSGATYIPIDPTYPEERIKFILEDTKAPIILTNKSYKNKLNNIIHSLAESQYQSMEIIDMDIIQEQLAKESTNNLIINNITCNNLACIMYTSGTTGQPKGVMIEHKGIVSLVINNNYLEISSCDNIMQLSNIAFDAATFEIFGALLNGAQLYIVGDAHMMLANIKLFKKVLYDKITILWLTKTLFDYLYLQDNALFSKLSCLLIGGEALNYELVYNLLISKYRPLRLINGYGPTENTTFSCTKEITIVNLESTRAITIGRPIANRTAYVLNKKLQPLPIGVVGELYVGGDGLSRGYLNDLQLTQKQFITNPFQDNYGKPSITNNRLYKTGDLVRMFPNGDIEYVGRSDSQVKIRGHRVETREIENILAKHADIKEAIVLIKKYDSESNNKNAYADIKNYMLAYYMADYQLDSLELQNYLSAKLPDYMVPNKFIHIKELPVTPNGKLNKAALPQPDSIIMENIYSGPRNKTEHQICEIISQVIRIPITNISINDNFFKIGGNSILAIQLLAMINEFFKVNLKPMDIFVNKTAEKLAQIILEVCPFKLIRHLNMATNKQNMFMIHPGFAGSEVYVTLANSLSEDYSCFGIDNYNLYTHHKVSNISHLAQIYIEAINEVRSSTKQGNSPYVLLGWSLGGQIAFEIATQLEQNGVSNINVILIDAILSDNILKKYISNLALEKEKFHEFLKSQGHIEGYINKVIDNFVCDVELAGQKPRKKLEQTQVLLFKAIQKGERKYFINYSLQNNYNMKLKYNNVDKWVDINHIKLVEMMFANHFTIIQEHQQIQQNIQKWYNSI